MADEASQTRILDLFKKLNVLIKSFVEDLNSVIELHSENAPSSEIKELMESIKSRHPLEEKDKRENEEILKLSNLLLKDEGIFSLMATESREWLSFLDSIEGRLEMGKEDLTEDELRTYKEIKGMTEELRGLLKDPKA